MENHPIDLKKLNITDSFWQKEMELVRTEVIPYQWKALNDQVPNAEPGFAMHNFKAAARRNERRRNDPDFTEPKFDPDTPFQVVPEGMSELDFSAIDGLVVDQPSVHVDPDHFYGFLFQDSDFYKWVEAVAYSLCQHPDAALEKTCDDAIAVVAAAQADDGYLDTYYILNGRDAEFTNLRDNHELYCFGHLTEASVAYYEATGKDSLMQVAMKYASYISSKIGSEEGKKHGYPGHEVAELALVRLYKATGDEKFLKLSEYFINERGKQPYYFAQEKNEVRNYAISELPFAYYQSHLPVRKQKEALGHSVRATYLYSGMADIARITKDDELQAACEALWKSITRDKMYITGGIGSTHIGEAFTFPYDLPNDTAYTESCASIGLVFFARRMLETEPKAEYADVMERAIYNGILSGIALDGKSFFYVNPLEVDPIACRLDARKTHVKPVRQKWFGCACCPPNIARLLTSIGAYAYTENEDTFFTNLYISCSYEKELCGKKADITVDVKQETGKWTVQYQVCNAAGLKLALRKPEWCDQPVLDGAAPEQVTEKDGYLYVACTEEETAFTLELPMSVRIMAADSRVRENAHKAAFLYGPTVYCLEEKDNGKALQQLSVSRKLDPSEIQINEVEIGGRTAEGLLVPGFRTAMNTEQGLYHPLTEEQKEHVTLQFIPYYMWANRGENEMQVWTYLD